MITFKIYIGSSVLYKARSKKGYKTDKVTHCHGFVCKGYSFPD